MPPKVKTKVVRQPAKDDFKGKRTIIRRFPQFSRLPIELRLMIWVLATWAPRLVKASWSTNSLSNIYISVYELVAGVVPAVLCVNQESRNAALKIYSQVPKFISFTGAGYKYKADKMIYLNTLDTIYFFNRPAQPQFLEAFRALKKYIQLDHFAIPADDLDKYGIDLSPPTPAFSPGLRLRQILKTHMSLNRIIVVVDRTRTKNMKIPTQYKLVPVAKEQRVICRGESFKLNKDKVEELIDEVWDEKEPEIAGPWTHVRAEDIKQWNKYKANNPKMLKPKVEMLRLVKK